MQNKRSLSVDITKGVAIIAIVLGHIGFCYPSCELINTQNIIYGLWHVPVFFIVAGFFINDDKLTIPSLWFRKKFSSLYLKILYFYIPAVLLHNVLIKIGWYSLVSTDPIIHLYSYVDFFKQTVFTVCLGGREPILGAMWFVYVLFMALIGLSIVSWLCKKITKNEQQYEGIRFILLLALCISAGILSNKYGLTIRRFSNVFTAMLLILIGKIMYRKLSFYNIYIFIICALIFFEVACMLGGVALNSNSYKDILQLIVAGPATVYMIMYVGKRIEHLPIGRALSYVGNNSFYIMALHFVGFKLCTITIQIVGLGGANLFDLTPQINKNIFLLFLYTVYGVGIPLLTMSIFRKIKKQFTKNH